MRLISVIRSPSLPPSWIVFVWPCKHSSEVSYPHASRNSGIARTWVPVPSMTVRNDKSRFFSRTGIPLRLCWALTVHKSQGLSCPEGVIANMKSMRPGRNPVAAMGLAFVAWSRATDWSRMAFRSLPPLGNFLAVRQSRDFKRREQFEQEMDSLHEQHMTSLGMSPSQEVQEHVLHMQRVAPTAGLASDADIGDLKAQLEFRGVQGLHDSVTSLMQGGSQTSNAKGLSQIAKAFRGQVKCKKKEGIQHAAPVAASRLDDHDKGLTCGRNVVSLLLDFGYPRELALAAVDACGPEIHAALDFCEAGEHGSRETKRVTAYDAAMSTHMQQTVTHIVYLTAAADPAIVPLWALFLGIGSLGQRPGSQALGATGAERSARAWRVEGT